MRHMALSVALCAALLSGCGGGTALTPGPALTGQAPVYRVAPDDKVRVTVFGETELTNTYTIGSDGTIAMPLIGNVKVAGLTLPELQGEIAQRLSRGYIRNPKVAADIPEYRPFYILGEVNRSGQYPYRVGMTVEAAVATAGGFTYRANRKVVAIKHGREPGEKRYRLSSDLIILPGDTVRVLERYF